MYKLIPHHPPDSTFTPSKPDITIHAHDTSGPILGAIKLNTLSSNVVCLGDPTSSLPDPQWERFQRPKSKKTWTHSAYEFDIVDGETGNRRTFTWKRIKQGFFADQPNMELRENVAVGSETSDKEEEEELGGDVWAVYKGCQGLFGRTRGRFYLKKGQGARLKTMREVAGSGIDLKTGSDSGDGLDGKDGKWGDWEVMVILTGCGAIETARRRSRARRGAAGGSGGSG